MLESLRKDLSKLKNPQKAQILQRFFKTGKGEYGEGDVFLGIIVPQSRAVARKYKGLSLFEIETILKSKIHEERLIALLILVENFKRGGEKEKRRIYKFYLRNTKYINNWDLVDLSATQVVGEYLLSHSGAKHPATPVNLKPKAEESKLDPSPAKPDQDDTLMKLIKSNSVWERRIAIIATYAFVKNNQFDITLGIASILLDDKHDLIQKAVGWMLREVGKKDQLVEEVFLQKHYKKMPRTMLRYAIERFDEKLRKNYLLGKI